MLPRQAASQQKRRSAAGQPTTAHTAAAAVAAAADSQSAQFQRHTAQKTAYLSVQNEGAEGAWSGGGAADLVGWRLNMSLVHFQRRAVR